MGFQLADFAELPEAEEEAQHNDGKAPVEN